MAEARLNLADAYFAGAVLLPKGARLGFDGRTIEMDHPPSAAELQQVRRFLAATMPRLSLSPRVAYRAGASSRTRS